MRVTRANRWRRVAVGAAAVPLAVSLAACGGGGDATDDGRLSVVASTDVWGDVVRQVGGDAVEVTSIIDDPSADPHSYEADAQVKLALSRADLVVENGGGYDDFVGTLLDSLSDRPPVIDAVDVSGYAASQGGELNEHVWYDVPTVAKVADAIAAELARVDPSQAATFTANAAAFGTKLDTIEADEAAVKAAHDGTGAAITEPVPVYLLEACGLVDRTPEEFSEAVEEGTDVPVSVLDRTLALFTDRTVAVLVYNEQTSGAETERVLAAARQAGVNVVPVTETLPEGQDYVGWMTANVAAVGAALA